MTFNQEEVWLLREKYNGEKNDAFFADRERLRAGVPLAYLIGSIPFLDCTIYLDSHPLIPRPETEYWTEHAIKTMVASDIVAPHILDLCAGSGAIGVAVAKAIPQALVTFAEIDPAHLPTIRKNLAQNITVDDSEQYTVLESDLFSHVSGQYDLILSNPPYIDKAAHTVESSVVEHEPHQALFGGKDGLELVAKIMSGSIAHLKPGGQLWVEHEPTQVDALCEMTHRRGFTVVTHPDQYGTPRYSIFTVAQ